MYVKKIVKWIVINRRIIGTILGSVLIAAGYETEGSYVTDLSGHL